MKLMPLMLLTVLALPFSVRAESPAGGEVERPGPIGGLFKRAANVDKPIPETYEPLNSRYIGDGEKLNQTIEQSWQLRQEAREREATEAADAAVDDETRRQLDGRIQEPDHSTTPMAEPAVRSTGSSLQISD